jgi:septal ring factor EnvC (AmiA/AmiB activator)
MGASSMSRMILTALLMLTLAGAVPARADSDDPQARLRAALKTATVRIRELEDQNAQLTAKQAAAERDKIDFTQKAAAADKELGELRQQTAADKTALDQASATQKQQGDSIAKWEASYNQAAEAARTRDSDAKRLDAVVGKLRPQVQSCEAKNAELYRIGEEVLDLYDKKDFLDLMAGEPVTKLKRVELENTMQDYEDKMRDNEIGRQTR